MYIKYLPNPLLQKYLLKINTRKWCEISLKLTIKTPKRRDCHRFGVFIVNLTYFKAFPSVFIGEFEQVNVCLVIPDTS